MSLLYSTGLGGGNRSSNLINFHVAALWVSQVFRYWPAGNVVGEFEQNVLPVSSSESGTELAG